MAEENFLYDSIEASSFEPRQVAANPYPPSHNPRLRAADPNYGGHPGVSDSFDYHYVDVNGDMGMHDLDPSETYPMPAVIVEGGYSNEDMYAGAYQNDQQYLAQDDTLPTEPEDPSFYYDSVDASALGYGAQKPGSHHFIEQNEGMPYTQHHGLRPSFPPLKQTSNLAPRTPQHDIRHHSSVLQDSLEIANNNEASRYEDVNAALMHGSAGGSYRQIQQHDNSVTIDEATLSFGSHDPGALILTGQPNYYNPDVNAHQHAINIQSSWRGYNTRQMYGGQDKQYPREDSRYEVYDPPTERPEELQNSIDVVDYDHKATVIQSNYRGYRSRKEYKLRREKAEKAKLIQSSYRGYRTRKKFVNERKIEPSTVKHYHKESVDKDKAAVKIQSNYRGYRARKKMKRTKAEVDDDDYAIVQASAQGYKSRKEFADERLRNEKATVIQSNYRGYKTRKDMRNGKYGRREDIDEVDAETIQAAANAYQMRKEHVEHKRSSSKSTRDNSKIEENDAAVIQAAANGYRIRKGHAEDLEMHRKAVVIQSNYRGYITRKSMQPLKRSSPPSRDETELESEQHAQVVQAATRGYQMRRDHASTAEDASVIQAHYRGYKHRKDMIEQASAEDASVIQAHYRGYKTRKDMKNQRKPETIDEYSNDGDDDEAADVVQANVSGYQRRKQMKNERDLNEQATVIQSSYRGYQSRKKRSERNEAAIIQGHARGYQARKQANGRGGNDEKESTDQVQASVRGYQARKKSNEEKNMEAAWDRNRRLQQEKKEQFANKKPRQPPPRVGSRKYTDYLDHSNWTKRQEKKKTGEPVSRLPTMLNSGEINGNNKQATMTPSKNSNVSFSEPYQDNPDSRSYPKSPIPPNTRELSEITSVYSEDESVKQQRERQKLRHKLLKNEKTPRRTDAGDIPNKDELRAEILGGDSYREYNEKEPKPRGGHQKNVRQKYSRKQIVRDYSEETLESNIEDDESLYEFDPEVRRVQDHKLSGYHKKKKWVKHPQYSEEETNEDEDDDELSSDEDYEEDYGLYDNGYYYGNSMPNYAPYPPMNGMPPGGHPHVAFVPVPWGKMHPLEQTLYAAQMGPGGMPQPQPPQGPYPNQHHPPHPPIEGRNQGPGKSGMASRKTAPAAPPPGKDFVEKNKTKAVQKEPEKGSYKNIALRSKKVKSEPEMPTEAPKVYEKKQVQNLRRSKETGLIEARTTASDNHHVKVDINLNIPPEQLAAMLGIDPSSISPRRHVTVSHSADKSPERKRNQHSKSVHDMPEPQLSNRASHENGLSAPKKRIGALTSHEPLINNYTDEKRGPLKQKEPNPYSKIPPIPSNPKTQKQHQQVVGNPNRQVDVSPHRMRKNQQMQPAPPQEPPRPIFYKPYTLEDYKNLNLDIKLPNHLGPDIDKIEAKRKGRDKQASYAKAVHEQNMQHIKTVNKFDKPIDTKQNKLSRRKVGLEYSKSVPKPKQPNFENDYDGNQESPPMSQDMQRLEELKRRHELDKSALAST
ncbi:uncharacterized protein LOC142342847 [Convolutriloba macropyga]|uniref:uncharacterized protein LOC142342847 n=1 Tax=Convolutriloba macropyga TaxID=536237 RepID=UPI003F51CCD8